MENKVSINNRSIESSGLVKDNQEAISEYIWNGFDASATKICINFSSNQIDNIQLIEISDNGTGINYETLNETFGNFLDSIKKRSFQRSSYIHGNKGKGRFSFTAFAGKAKWLTTYFDSNSKKYLEYTISISKNSKDKYVDNDRKISKNNHTGTKVLLTDLYGVTAFDFLKNEFTDYLAREFGWFLFLNKDKEYKITLNDTEVAYDHIIAESDITDLKIEDADHKSHIFKITFIRWSEKIGDEKFYFYFLDSHKREIAKELTSYNNNAVDFHHSVFIESEYFDSFSGNDDEQGNLFLLALKVTKFTVHLSQNCKLS